MNVFNCFMGFAALVFFAAFSAAPAAQAQPLDPEATSVAFVQKMGDKALTSLTGKDISDEIRVQRVRELLRDNFDIKTIGRFVLGPSWRSATEAQKKEYMSLFEDMIVETYAQRFKEYSGQSFKVSSANRLSDRDTLVKSSIMQENGPPVSVDWRVRNKNGDMKVVDVIVEDISMSVTQRSDFTSVINSGGGMDGLINSLRKRVGSIKITKKG